MSFHALLRSYDENISVKIQKIMNHLLVNNVKYSGIADYDDDARDDKCDDKKSCFTTSAIDIG